MIGQAQKIVQKQQKLILDLQANSDMRDDMKETRTAAIKMAKQYLYSFAVCANIDLYKDTKPGSKQRADCFKELETLEKQMKDMRAYVFVCAWCSFVV